MIKISGIFGYIGNEPCIKNILKGINTLSGRGFEAAGIAIQNNNELLHTRINGNIPEAFENEDSKDAVVMLAQCSRLLRAGSSNSVILPSTNNLYSVAVDGFIGNFHTLKRWSGEPFPIVTDEDLMLSLLCVTTKTDKPQDKIEVMRMLKDMLEGDITAAFICCNQKAIYCMAGAKPLLIGKSRSGFYISSEEGALSEVAEKYIALSRGEHAKVTAEKVYIYDANLKRIKKTVNQIANTRSSPIIYSYSEQLSTLPSITKGIFNAYVNDGRLNFKSTGLTSRLLNRMSSIILTGEGGAFNMAQIIRTQLELMTDIPVAAIPCGELRHNGAILDNETLVIALSATGEENDTIHSVIRANELNAKTVGLCCNHGTHLERLCNHMIFADGEYSKVNSSIQHNTALYFAACLMSLHISSRLDIARDSHINLALKMAQLLSGKILSATKALPGLTMLATRLSARSNIILTGLGADYPLSVEGAAALRKIASLSCASYPVCNLISAYDATLASSTIIAPITNEAYLPIITPYLLRARAMGAEIIILTMSSIEDELRDFDNIISFDDSIPLFNPIIILSAIYKTTTIIDEINNSNRLDDAI